MSTHFREKKDTKIRLCILSEKYEIREEVA